MDEYPIDSVPLGSVENVYTTHVTHQELFYVHIESRSKILDDIMANLDKRYRNVTEGDKVLTTKRQGCLCAAKFTDDGFWYRAKITRLIGADMIEVQFVDYGNTDFVSEDRVKVLDPDLVQFPVQSYKCALAGVSSSQDFWPPELMVQFEDIVIDKRCKAIFKGTNADDVYLVEMYNAEGVCLNQVFGASKLGSVPAIAEKGMENGHETRGFRTTEWKIGDKLESMVVYISSPSLFWCQDLKYSTEIIVLSEKLSRLHMTQEITPLSNISPGTVCAARFHEDRAWYRGIVQSVSKTQAKVYFVDFGNVEFVDLDSICGLRPDLMQMPALAVKCCLANLPRKGQEWSPECIEAFETLVLDREFEVNVVNKVDDTFMITLLDIEKNEDVADQLQPIVSKYGGVKNSSPDTYVNKDVNSNCSSVASSDPGLTVGSVKDVFLTWVNSPGDFWVQCADSTELVESMSEQLQAYYSQPRAQGPSHPGSLVVAKFSEDQLWYRGLVLKVNEEEAEVLFIDYGNSDIVLKAELKKAASQLGQVHPMAQQCSLAGVRPLHNDNTWSADAKDFLEKLTEHGCQCRVVGKRENHLSVQLSVNGKDLAQELTSLAVVAESRDSGHKQKTPVPMFTKNAMLQRDQSENVTVTFVDSPHSFWCQLARNYTDINSLMEKLEAHYSDEGGTPVSKPVLGQACIAQYSADNAWYRATLTNTSSQGFDVHFIDFGNTETVSPHGVCIPEPKFLDLPTQAVQCSLSLVGDLNHLSDILTDLILEKELTLKVLDFHGDLAVVELYDGSQLVSEMLKSAQSSASVTAPLYTGLKFSPAKAISVGATVTAFTSVVVSPSKFFLQMAGIDEELAILMDNIASRYTSGSELGVTNPAAGQDCVAKYSEDDQWYRGKILSVQNGQCTVLFVDYGNEENISMASIKALNPECASVPIMAYECSLHGIESRSWSEKAVEFFESLVMDKELCCTFVTPSKVKLSSEGHDIATQLVDAGYTQAERTVKPADTIAGDDVGASSSFGSRRSGEGGVKAGFGRDYGETKERSSQNVEDSGGFGRKTGDSDRGGRNSFGGRASGFGGGRHDDDEEKVGFGDRSSGFGGGGGRRGGDREGGSGFGGGRRDRKATSDSDGNESTTFTYADPPSEPEKAVLVHMDDDGTFYLQLLSMEKEILFLARRLAGSYKGGSGPRMREAAAEGSVCCGKFPGDGSMYRCSVEGVQGNKILVRYMDYGNTAECTPYDLKFLFPDLLQYPVQAFPCKLRGLEWSLDQGEKFAAATLDKDLEVTFTTTTKPFEVEIKTPDGDLLDIMTGKIVPKPSPKPSSFETGSKTSPKGFGGFGSKTMNENESPKSLDKAPSRQVPKQEFKSQSVLPGEHSAYISHVGEDGYFYLQLEKDTETLDSVSDKLVGLPAGEAHPNITTGAACAAVYSEDSSWYRAVIYSKDGDRLKVTFVDYGNGDTVDSTSIKPLNEELLSSAPMAYQCQFPDVGPLAVELRDKVSEYLTDHQMTVTFQSKEAPFEVSITTVDGEDFREIICPSSNYRSQPVPKGVLPVSVSHMELENDGKFFLQLFRDYNTVKEIQDALSADYGLECEEKMENPEVDSPCCVKREDGLWYRGKIVKIDDGSIDVFHVDFGYTSSVDCSCLRTLQAKHLKKAPQALECRLKGVETWTESLKEKFVDMTQDKVLNATFFSDTPPYRVSLARSIELDLLGLNSPLPDSPTRLSAEKQEPVITGDSSVDGERSYMPHVETDGTFYVQTVVREQDLYAMTEKLEEALASATELTGVEVGAHVCAKFTEDDSWYRATVEGQSDEEKYSVRFVDYGNTDVVGADRLAAIPEGMDLNLISPFASKCQFAGVSLGLTQEQVDQLRNLVADQIVTVIFRSKGDNVQLVDVALNGKQLTETLGLSQDVEGDSSVDGERSYMPHVETDGTFYVQTVVREQDLYAMTEKLEEALASATELTGVEVGGHVCAKFTEDDSWYRATVEGQSDEEKYSVRFVDYGNTDVVGADRLAAIPEGMDLNLISPFASKCQFAGVSLGLTQEQVDQLRNLVADQIVTVVVRSKGDNVQLVDVALNGKQLTETLGLSQDVEGDSSVDGERSYMPHVETDGTFYVQTVVREQDLYAMTEKLEEALASATELTGVEVGGHVCAKFTEDDSWYRATVEGQSDEEKYSVRFVDYGNTDVVGADRLAAIPEGMDLNLISPFASKCQFAGVSLGLTHEQVDQLRNLVADQIVTVVVRSKGDNVELVDVALNGKQLTETLGLSQDVEENIEAKEDDEFEDAVENFEESDSVNPEMGLTTNDSEVSGGISDFAAVSLGQRVAVTVSYLESPDMFYFQLETNQGLLDQLMNSMYEHFSSLQEGEGLAEKVDVGDSCAVLYHDESWYRGKVEAVNEDESYQIRFIDYGNVESVTITGLRSLPNVFMGQPCMCRVAKLAGVSPVGTGWTDEAVADFRTMVEEKSLLADIVRLDEEQCCVHLLELGISVHQELIKKGHATASSEDVAVSKSVQQVFSDTNESLLAAKSLNVSDCLESTHLDGDEETAKQAMMTLGAHVDEDQDQGISPQDIVNLNTHTRQKISCVSNSLNELEEVEVYVCHSENPSAFWCQLASSTDALEDLSSSLADTYQSPEEADRVLGSLNPSDIVVAVFSEDEQLYRSEVLASSHIPSADESVSEEKVSVQFVDYGNKSEVYRNQVYKIRDSLCKLPRQAFCCCLDGIQPVGSEWTADACERFSDLVRDHKLSLKLVGRKEVEVALVELVLLESSRCVSSMLVEEAHASLVARTAKDLNASSISRGANLSAMDSLEISQPIMESTAMVENISNQVQTFSYEADSNSQYRYLCLSLHTEYDVTVSNCELPNGFHVQLNALQNQFSSLMAELAEYVVSDAFEEKADFIPELHAPVLVQKCGVWYRGLVKSIDEEECTVLAVDCGWELTIPQQTLTALPERFLDLPAQAVSCYLAGVVSVEPAWCTDAITFFSDCVKNCKMCIYVLENAEDGKYGVYMSDLDSTTTQSLNRAMVDLGYADVVPGSNIEVQIEMEKTLDTELLSDLEASFNEVKDQKENAYDDNGKEAGTSRASSENLLKDTNKDYFSNSLESAEENLFHLIPSSHGRDSGPSAIEGAHTTASGDTEKGSDHHHHHHHQEFSLSSVVERIDKLGLVDAYFDEPCMPPLDEVEESDISGTDVPAVVTPVNEASPQSDANADQVSAVTTQAKSLYTWKQDAESKDAKTSDSEGRPLESEAEGGAESESDRSKESLGNSCQVLNNSARPEEVCLEREMKESNKSSVSVCHGHTSNSLESLTCGVIYQRQEGSDERTKERIEEGEFLPYEHGEVYEDTTRNSSSMSKEGEMSGDNESGAPCSGVPIPEIKEKVELKICGARGPGLSGERYVGTPCATESEVGGTRGELGGCGASLEEVLETPYCHEDSVLSPQERRTVEEIASVLIDEYVRSGTEQDPATEGLNLTEGENFADASNKDFSKLNSEIVFQLCHVPSYSHHDGSQCGTSECYAYNITEGETFMGSEKSVSESKTHLLKESCSGGPSQESSSATSSSTLGHRSEGEEDGMSSGRDVTHDELALQEADINRCCCSGRNSLVSVDSTGNGRSILPGVSGSLETEHGLESTPHCAPSVVVRASEVSTQYLCNELLGHLQGQQKVETEDLLNAEPSHRNYSSELSKSGDGAAAGAVMRGEGGVCSITPDTFASVSSRGLSADMDSCAQDEVEKETTELISLPTSDSSMSVVQNERICISVQGSAIEEKGSTELEGEVLAEKEEVLAGNLDHTASNSTKQSDSICSLDSNLAYESLDTTVEDYESCSEHGDAEHRNLVDIHQEDTSTDTGDNCFAESSFDSLKQAGWYDSEGRESNYDTSSLVFSDYSTNSPSTSSSSFYNFSEISGLESSHQDSEISGLESSHQDSFLESSVAGDKSELSSSTSSLSSSPAGLASGSSSTYLESDKDEAVLIRDHSVHTDGQDTSTKGSSQSSISDLDINDLSGLEGATDKVTDHGLCETNEASSFQVPREEMPTSVVGNSSPDDASEICPTLTKRIGSTVEATCEELDDKEKRVLDMYEDSSAVACIPGNLGKSLSQIHTELKTQVEAEGKYAKICCEGSEQDVTLSPGCSVIIPGQSVGDTNLSEMINLKSPARKDSCIESGVSNEEMSHAREGKDGNCEEPDGLTCHIVETGVPKEATCHLREGKDSTCESGLATHHTCEEDDKYDVTTDEMDNSGPPSCHMDTVDDNEASTPDQDIKCKSETSPQPSEEERKELCQVDGEEDGANN